MNQTYIYGGGLEFISVFDGLVTLNMHNKTYQYQLESNYQWYDILLKNSFPTQVCRIVKLSILNDLRQYQINN